jgi:short-subunit dehydrogenase
VGIPRFPGYSRAMPNVLITGASSGIGRALAIAHAADGVVLALLGRDAERLESVAAECRRRGATVRTGSIDVRARDELKAWIEAFDRDHPVDLVFANAGVLKGTPPDREIETADAAVAMVEANVVGVLNTVQPLLAPFMARGRGQIAIMSSLAAFVPLPDAPSYCASRAATLSYGLSLRSLLAPRGIRVSVICPGYVTTPMTARESGRKPLEMSPERAVAIIRRGLQRDRAVIAFPFLIALASRINRMLPDRLRRWTLKPFRFTVADS